MPRAKHPEQPAYGGALKHYTHRNGQITVRRDKQMRTFYEEVSLPEFKEACHFSSDPKFQMLWAALANPRLHSSSFADLCKRCKLTISDVTALWRNHQIQRGMLRQMNHMPDVMEDIAIDSRSRTYHCNNCDGTGKAPFGKKQDAICPACHGDGTIREHGDKDARSLLFESAGLRKATVANVQQVNIGQLPSLEDTLRDLEKVTDLEATSVETDVDEDQSGRCGEGAAAAEREPGEAADVPDASGTADAVEGRS